MSNFVDAKMLLALLTVLLQFERARMYNAITSGHEIFYIRGTEHLSWITAREACDNMSHAILPGMRNTRALGLLNVGEFAWIDGKEYTFCLAKNVYETQEICRYVTVTREDIKENFTYICNEDGLFKMSKEILSYTDAVKSCQKSSTFLQVVENFVLPMIVPVNRTDWIKDFNYTSIISRLGPVGKVNERCIGIVRLESERFEFGTTSCDENHTVICYASAVRTALTLTTRNEMMPRLGDIQARLTSNHPQTVASIKTALTLATRDEMMPRLGDSKAAIASKKQQNVDTMQIFLALGSIFGFISFLLVLGAIFSFAIMKYRKCRRQCQETLSRDNTSQGDAESVGYVIVL